MKKDVYLYNIFITLNGEITDLAIDELLDKITPLEEGSRTKKVFKANYTCISQTPDLNLATSRNRKMGFGKYRTKNPYNAAGGIDNASLITNKLLEITSVVIIPTYRMLVAEYNHYGPRISAIAHYLSEFLPNDEENTWEVIILPIESELGWKDISKSKEINTVEITLDTAGASKHFLAKNSKQEIKSSIFDLLKQTVDLHSTIGSNVATIKLGKGRKKEALIVQELLPLLEVLAIEESDAFMAVKITYRSPSKKRIETVNLKQAGVYTMEIENIETNSSWEFITNTISDTFYSKRRPKSNYFSKNYELITPEFEFPEIIITPGPEFSDIIID